MSPNPNSTIRNLGQCLGHVWQAIKTDPAPACSSSASTLACQERVHVRTRIAEAPVQTPAGELLLRRTTIDEVTSLDSAARRPTGAA